MNKEQHTWKNNVIILEPGIVLYKEIGQHSFEYFDYIFEEIDRLFEQNPILIVDLRKAEIHSLEMNQYLIEKAKQYIDRPSHVCMVLGNNLIMDAGTIFIMSLSGIKSYSIHISFEAAVKKAREVDPFEGRVEDGL